MNHDTPRILLVSSRGPEHSANLGGDVVNSLRQQGCDVDILTLYPSLQAKDYDIYSVVDEIPISTSGKLRKKLPGVSFKILKFIFKPVKDSWGQLRNALSKKRRLRLHLTQSGFFYPDESHPNVSPERLLNTIPQDKEYDLVITLFWQDMLNTTSLMAIYERFGAPIYIYSVDMAPMTGGCYYFNSCNHYTHQCGECPCLLSDNKSDQSHQNYITKKKNYSAIEAYFLGNSWMIDRALASKLFNADSVLNMGIIIDEKVFCPKNSLQARQELKIPEDKDLVLMARSLGSTRKGADTIVYALNMLWEKLPKEERQRLCLVTVGDATLEKKLKGGKIPVINLGTVGRDVLIKAYQAASLFLSPSTDDAGPSMVNQSIMCGTPVVSFNIGTAVDVIENGISGFKTDDLSKEGFARTLGEALHATVNATYPDIRATARVRALQHNTSQAFAEKLLLHFRNRRNH